MWRFLKYALVQFGAIVFNVYMTYKNDSLNKC